MERCQEEEGDLATNLSLDVEPTVGNECIKEDDVGVTNVKYGVGEDYEWDTVASAGLHNCEKGLEEDDLGGDENDDNNVLSISTMIALEPSKTTTTP